jgi:pimeloyl-ACP methyl ester carboxylesterase
MPVLDIGEVQLSFERSGSGAPLLMIMGMSGTARHWGEPFLEDLRDQFELITYDHRGVGQSSKMNGPFTIADLANDAAGLLSALELDSVHVLGISMGGMVAQELALTHPHMIRTLTLGCSYCGGEGSSLTSQEVLQKLAGAAMSGDRERALRTAWEANVSEQVAEAGDLYEVFHQIGLKNAVAMEVILAQSQAISAHDTSTRLSSLHMPTMIVHGTEDQMLAVTNAYAIKSHLPDARLEILDGVGHLFFWELPDRSAELIIEHASAHV